MTITRKSKPRQIYPFHKGDVIDKITILEDDFVFVKDRYLVKFQCECGNIDYRRLSDLQKMSFKCCHSCCSKVKYPEQRKQRGYFDENGINISWLNHLNSTDNLNRGKKVIEFNLTTKDLYDVLKSQNFKCAYTGVDLNVINTFKYDSNGSVDRIDSSKGYVKDNIQWVLKPINIMKNNFSDEEFKYLCKMVSDFTGQS